MPATDPLAIDLRRCIASTLDGTVLTENDEVIEALTTAVLRATATVVAQRDRAFAAADEIHDSWLQLKAESATDPLAHERFRTTLADAIGETGYDAYAAGSDADPDVSAGKVLDASPEAHFEREINGAGVAMRRVVAVGVWEVDPIQPSAPAPVLDASESAFAHPFVPVRYKGHIEDECGHVTMISGHEGRMCNLPRENRVHLG